MAPKTKIEGENALHRNWRQLRKSLRKIGLMYTLQEGLTNIIPPRIFRWGSFFLTDTTWPDVSDTQASHEGMRVAVPADAAQVAQTKSLPKPLQHYLDRGYKISLYEVDGEIAGVYMYGTHHHDHWDWLQFDMAEGDLWAASLWIRPDLRGQDLHLYMRAFNIHTWRPEGYSRVLATVEAWNVSSLRAALKTSQIAGACSYVRLFTFTMMWLDGRLRVGFWRPAHRLVVQSDEVHADAGEKFGRHKIEKLRHHIYGRTNQAHR